VRRAFVGRIANATNPALEGRLHFRFIDSLVTFGCLIFDQSHWSIDFPPNPSDPRGGAILLRNHPEGARVLASFVRHQWLERPDVTMSLTEAYERWKTMRPTTPSS
jgi:hypothetical protein